MAEAVQGPTFYLIRHGEKDEDPDGEDIVGLSEKGKRRAKALVEVFDSPIYNIGKIFAQAPHKHHKQERPFKTVEPLAEALAKDGVEFDFTYDRDDPGKVANAIKSYNGKGNVLVCWEHKKLQEVAEALIGSTNVPEYPKERFDLIWTILPPHNKLNEISSEHCPIIDDAYINEQPIYL